MLIKYATYGVSSIATLWASRGEQTLAVKFPNQHRDHTTTILRHLYQYTDAQHNGCPKAVAYYVVMLCRPFLGTCLLTRYTRQDRPEWRMVNVNVDATTCPPWLEPSEYHVYYTLAMHGIEDGIFTHRLSYASHGNTAFGGGTWSQWNTASVREWRWLDGRRTKIQPPHRGGPGLSTLLRI